MDQIEVNIKLAENNKIYTLPIGKSDTILKLKEYCKIISKIPQDQQNLLYNGKLLLNEKNISDYNIENNHNIILVKKNYPNPLNHNSNHPNLNKNLSNNNNINSSNAKVLGPNDFAVMSRQLSDISSLYSNMDFNLFDNLTESLGLGRVTEMIGADPKKIKEMLKDPSIKNEFNNMMKDPSIAEIYYNHPAYRSIFKNPILNDKPEIINNFPQYFQMFQNMLKEKGRNPIENSGTGISVPPDPFGSLNNNQINQMMNSSGQIPNNSAFNNNDAGSKWNFINSGINIEYKEKYKEQLSQLKNMGFINEENNIQALKQSNGNIDNALDKLLKMNN